MSSKLKFCPHCAKTKENVHLIYPTAADVNFHAGYLFTWDLKDFDNAKTCDYCGTEIVELQMTAGDFLDIRDASNSNRQLLEAMLELQQKDIVEYELKMSQFRVQAEQVRQLRQDEWQRKEDERKNRLKKQIQEQLQRIPRCPSCHSTNIEKISMADKILGGMGLGILSSNVRNTMRCRYCGYKW